MINSAYVEFLIYKEFPKINTVELCQENDVLPVKSVTLFISGRAPFLTKGTLNRAMSVYQSGILQSAVEKRNVTISTENPMFLGIAFLQPVNAFIITDGSDKVSYMQVPSNEGVVVNTVNDFELALVLQKKKINKKVLTDSILARIEEKRGKLINGSNDQICLVGHSQLDNWDIETLCGHKVRNCGIRGISSFEYDEYIMKQGLLCCSTDIYIMMHGTNDIVYDCTDDQILSSIQNSIDYIYEKKQTAKIFFISILNVNGRLDRSNKRIDALNVYLKNKLKDIEWIDTFQMVDEFGNLKKEYTLDGLHLSAQGYRVFQDIVENKIKPFC